MTIKQRLDRLGRVVAHRLGLFLRLWQFGERDVFRRFVDGFAGQDRVHALDGADAHLRMRIDVAAGQALHVVQLGELAAIVRRRVRHELLMRLLAEVARIDQEQDAFGTAELEQAVDRVIAIGLPALCHCTSARVLASGTIFQAGDA